MTAISGFWSYVHDDDDAESGRIAQLARDVRAQFEMLTGESIELFLDRDELGWGDDWKPDIDAYLASVAFFVPVITSRYFKSKECRRELNFFARRAESLGIKELVLPVLWVNFPGLRQEHTDDELVTLVKKFQWSDWTALKFAELGSGEYRKQVSQLAERLVQANAAAEAQMASMDLNAYSTAEEDDESLGTLDKLAAMESSLPHMTQVLIEVGHSIEDIGRAMQAATLQINADSNPKAELANRLRVARALADGLAEPAGRIRAFGGDFASSLNEVDEGVRVIIGQAPFEVAGNPESRGQFDYFFSSIRELVQQAEIGFGAISNMVDQMEPIEKMSRDLRRPLRTLREGLTIFIDGLSVMRTWVRLIDQVEQVLNQ